MPFLQINLLLHRISCASLVLSLDESLGDVRDFNSFLVGELMFYFLINTLFDCLFLPGLIPLISCIRAVKKMEIADCGSKSRAEVIRFFLIAKHYAARESRAIFFFCSSKVGVSNRRDHMVLAVPEHIPVSPVTIDNAGIFGFKIADACYQ